MCAEDIERELLVGRAKAYQIIKALNKELDKNGGTTRTGSEALFYGAFRA